MIWKKNSEKIPETFLESEQRWKTFEEKKLSSLKINLAMDLKIVKTHNVKGFDQYLSNLIFYYTTIIIINNFS